MNEKSEGMVGMAGMGDNCHQLVTQSHEDNCGSTDLSMAKQKQVFNELMDLFVLKTHEIENNLLDLMSKLIAFERHCNEKQSSVVKTNKLLVNKTVLKAFEEFSAKIDNNLKTLSKITVNTSEENHSLKQQLNDCLRREDIKRQQLKSVRNLYHKLLKETEEKEWQEWEDICEKEVVSVSADNTTQDISFDKFIDNLKSILTLIWFSTKTEATVKTFIESEEEFKLFMKTLLNIIQKFISDSLKELEEFDDNCVTNKMQYNSDIIENICGICVNIFCHRVIRNSEIFIEDIDQWIDSLITIHAIDIQSQKDALMALFNISFSAKGLEVLVQKSGFVLQLVNNINTNGKDFDNNKTFSLQFIHHLIIHSKHDRDIHNKLIEEIIYLLPINRIQEITVSDYDYTVREEAAKLLATIGLYATHHKNVWKK